MVLQPSAPTTASAQLKERWNAITEHLLGTACVQEIVRQVTAQALTALDEAGYVRDFQAPRLERKPTSMRAFVDCFDPTTGLPLELQVLFLATGSPENLGSSGVMLKVVRQEGTGRDNGVCLARDFLISSRVKRDLAEAEDICLALKEHVQTHYAELMGEPARRVAHRLLDQLHNALAP
jgi:histone H3/H4